MILDASELAVVAAASAAGLVGMYVERGRVAAASLAKRRSMAPDRPRVRRPFRKDGRPYAAPLDAAEQLGLVAAADFEVRPLLSRGEARVLEAAERAVAEQRLMWRVLAQVSLGEILWSSDETAFRAIQAKRVDVLIVAQDGRPLAALEEARCAVTKAALEKAGLCYMDEAEDIAGQIARLAGGVRAQAARSGARKPRSAFT